MHVVAQAQRTINSIPFDLQVRCPLMEPQPIILDFFQVSPFIILCISQDKSKEHIFIPVETG